MKPLLAIEVQHPDQGRARKCATRERYFWGCGRRTCIMPIVLSSTCATSASPAPPGLVPVPTRPFMHLSYREWKESSNSSVSSMRLIIFNLTKISDVTRPQHVVFPRNVFAFSYTLITIDKIRTITIGKWVDEDIRKSRNSFKWNHISLSFPFAIQHRT